MTGADVPRILLVDDHALLAESLAVALRAEGVDARLADLTEREHLIASVRRNPPDLILLDLELGNEIGDGATLVPPFVQSGSRVLILSASRRRAQLATAIEQGAVGVVSKSAPLQHLISTVLAVIRGQEVMPPDQRRAMLQDLHAGRKQEAARLEPFRRLTGREGQVLRELGNGKSVGAIAAEWYVSEATVRSQVRGVLMKLGVGSQLEAVAQARRAGWLGDARRGSRPAKGP